MCPTMRALRLPGRHMSQKLFSPSAPCRGNKFRCVEQSPVLLFYVPMETAEFTFTSELPQRKTRKGFFSGIKAFFEETGGGAIPVQLAAKMVKVHPETIRRWVSKGKVRGFRSGSTILVNIHDLELQLDAPKDAGGRPKST